MARVLQSSISPGISALADAIAGYGANKARANYAQAQMENMIRDDERQQEQLQIQRDNAALAQKRFEFDQANQVLTNRKTEADIRTSNLTNTAKQSDINLENQRISTLDPTANVLTEAVVGNVERRMPDRSDPSAPNGVTPASLDALGSDIYRLFDIRDQAGQLARNEVLSNKDLDAAKWIDDTSKTFAAGVGPVAPGGDGTIKDPFQITKEFNSDKQVQANQVATATLNSMWNSFSDRSAISDYDFIIGAAKIMDPTSVVRTQEGEQVQATQAMPAQYAGLFNRIINGNAVLDDKTRADIYRLAERRTVELQKQVGQQRDFYSNTARANGYDPATYLPPTPAMPNGTVGDMQDYPRQPAVLQRVGVRPPAAPAQPAAQQAPAVDISRVTPQDAQTLRSDPSPEAIADFNSHYGPGAAEQLLGAQ